MKSFQSKLDEWLAKNISEEKSPRRKERLEKGLEHATSEFLRLVWYPTIGNFDHLYPEWEVRDFNNGYRYIDLAYMPPGAMGAIEIQGYGPHARDLDVRRFKDLCWRHSLLALDDWILLPIAYLSIKDETKQCQQLILSFIGKFLSLELHNKLSYTEAEIIRHLRRMCRPLTPLEIAEHLHVSDRQARKILHSLVERQILSIVSGKERARTYYFRQK